MLVTVTSPKEGDKGAELALIRCNNCRVRAQDQNTTIPLDLHHWSTGDKFGFDLDV